MPAGSFTRPAGRSAAVRSRDQLDRLTTWPATDRPRCRPGTRATAASRTSTGSPRGRLPTCILVEALDTLPWSMPAGSFTRPAGRSAAVRSRDQLDRLTTWPATDRPRCRPGTRATAASRTSTGSPRGRLPTCILVEALDTFTRSMPAGSFTRPAGRSAAVRSRDQLDRLTTWPATDRPRCRPGTRATAASRTSTGSHVAVCRRASWSRPSTRSPGRCRRGASRSRAADRRGPGPGRHGRGAGPRHAPTWPFADVHPGRGPGHAPLVDAGGELHVAGLPIGADQDQGDTAAGRTSTRSHVAVCRRASWSRPWTRSPDRCRRGASRGRLTIGADQDQGDTTAGRTSTRSHVAGCRRASWSRPSTASPGRCRRGASRGRVADRCGPGPGRHGRGQDPDTLPRGRVCRRASWSRLSTRSPGRCRR